MNNLVYVYHAQTANDRDFRIELDFARGDKLVELVKSNLNKYKMVASPYRTEVKLGQILNDAYHTTNSIDSAWYEDTYANPTYEAAQGCRSTSIGDIIEFAGVKYVVDSYGFTALED